MNQSFVVVLLLLVVAFVGNIGVVVGVVVGIDIVVCVCVCVGIDIIVGLLSFILSSSIAIGILPTRHSALCSFFVPMGTFAIIGSFHGGRSECVMSTMVHILLSPY